MTIENIFYNEFGRLRSGWRFMLFLLSFFFLGAFLHFAVLALRSAMAIDYGAGSLLFLLSDRVIQLFLALLLGWVFGRYLEDLPFRALGAWFTRNWLKDFVFGLLFGAAAIVLAVSIGMFFGNLNFQINRDAASDAIFWTLLNSLVFFLIAAAYEEVFVRGYLLQTLARARLAWLAIILTSVFFALLHLGNPQANVFSSVNTGLAGIWFGMAYLKTRTLWFPLGLHMIWNWLQGAVFGIEVSGITEFTPAPLLKEIDAGPGFVTGAQYGIEGGIACTIALLLSIALIYFVPFLKPTEEMLAFTSEEKPTKRELRAESKQL